MNRNELLEKATKIAMKSTDAYPRTREQMTAAVAYLIDGGEYSYWPARMLVGYEALTLIEKGG